MNISVALTFVKQIIINLIVINDKLIQIKQILFALDEQLLQSQVFQKVAQMNKDRSIVIDNVQINPRVIQTAFDSGKSSQKTYEVLSQVFKLMGLSKMYDSNPADQQTKQMIKSIVYAQFLPANFVQNPYKSQLDLSQAFPLNKLGNFGRELERKCRVSQKGLMEFEDNNTPKLKPMKTFINKIQAIGSGSFDNKIGWIAQSKKYPYRIIVIDKSDGHKGIYFNTEEKAELVRIFLAQNFKYGGNFPNLIHKLNNNHENVVMQAFKNKIIMRNKMMRYTRNDKLNESSIKGKSFESKYQQPLPQQNTSMFYNQVLNISNKDKMQNNSRDLDMLRITGLLQTKQGQRYNVNSNQFKKLQMAYRYNLLKTWKDKSLSVRSNYPKRSMNSNQILSKNGSEVDNRSKFGSQIYGKSSKKQQNSYYSKQKGQSYQASSIKQKQSFVKSFQNDYSLHEQLSFYSIEFLTLKNLFFKPIVTIQIIRQNQKEQSIICNTTIKKKQPYLTYQLIPSDQQTIKLMANLKDYDIVVRVIDFLANEEVVNDKFTLKNKKVLQKTVLTGDNKTIRIELGVHKNQQTGAVLNKSTTIQLIIPSLDQDIKEKINAYWQRQSQSQGYYNQTNLSIYKILSQIESIPLTWWRGLKQDDYQLYNAFYNASKILGFKMIRSIPHLIRAFQKIFPDVQEMVERLLSFIITFMKTYYYAEDLQRLQKFHKLMGLQDDCQFISKVNLEILTIKKIVQFECPILVDKINRRNITYGYKMMQYIYEAFSRNFAVNCLVELWNYFYSDIDLLQLNMILACVVLIKYYEQDLMKAKRLKDFCEVLESLRIVKIKNIIKQISTLKQRYFGQAKGFLDQIKNIFNSNPLEPVLFDFFKRETAKIDKRRNNREIEKKSTMRKVNKQIGIEFPYYDNKKYTLHIYFRKLPIVGGSLTIRCNEVDYQCLNHEKTHYFIIGEVSSKISVHFLDLKSNQFSCELILNPGINQFTTLLTSAKNSTVYKIIYIAGLLTDSQIQIFKKVNKFDHFISPFVKELQFFEEMNRPIQQTQFLKKYDSTNSRDDLVKKIKSLFCSGTKTFNEIQFYIEQIQSSELTIEQKLQSVRQYGIQLSIQYCLCYNQIYDKHFFKLFFEKTGFQMDDYQFQCFYNDSLEYEFDAPKIIKCRYIISNQPGKQIKLENEALQYFIEKNSKYLYGDIIIDEFINYIKGCIIQLQGNIFEGELKLLYSTNGEVYLKSWLVKIKNKNKDIQYQEIKQDTADDIEEMEIGQPELLMTQILPSFAKISTILDYVNTNKQIDLKTKYQEKDRKKLAENINIIKDCQLKLNRVIAMRHQTYPQKIDFPFFNYYYQLTHEFSIPFIKNIFLNNLKSDLKSLCLFENQLKLGQNAKVQSYHYRNQIGLYGNLRQLSKDAKGWFFFGYTHEQHEAPKQEGKAFVNYGYGVFRWEPCYVLGFTNKIKPRNGKNHYSQPKKQYLVLLKNQQRYVKVYEIQIKASNEQKIPQISKGKLGILQF